MAKFRTAFTWSGLTRFATTDRGRSRSTPSTSPLLNPRVSLGVCLRAASVVCAYGPPLLYALTGRLCCMPKAWWKLSWFLRDFGYDAELFGHEEIDDQALVGLSGVVKVSRTVVNGRSLLNLDAFASPPHGPEPAHSRLLIRIGFGKRPHDLQLHPTRAVSRLPTAIPLSLPGRLARERDPGRTAVRTCLRASCYPHHTLRARVSAMTSCLRRASSWFS